jgi:hypothetical protein
MRLQATIGCFGSEAALAAIYEAALAARRLLWQGDDEAAFAVR